MIEEIEDEDPDASANVVDNLPELDDGDDLYEVCVDRTLSNAVSYGKGVVEVAHIIHRGALGMDGFCKWIQICLVDVGIAVALLEMRVERVCDTMKLLCVIPWLCLPNTYDDVSRGANEPMEKPTESPSADQDILFTRQSDGHPTRTMQCCLDYQLELGGCLP